MCWDGESHTRSSRSGHAVLQNVSCQFRVRRQAPELLTVAGAWNSGARLTFAPHSARSDLRTPRHGSRRLRIRRRELGTPRTSTRTPDSRQCLELWLSLIHI
eukprot:13196015-Alexandrium_andersonii.AAC.1